MADFLKWIKLVVDLFDDEKILLIESMPNADSIIIIWIKLICLAGKLNNSGVFSFKNGLPYTEKMLATIFRRDEELVSFAINTFENFGMIQTVNGVVTITNWGKHQSVDKIEANREYMRNYMKKYNAKQKAIATGEADKVKDKVKSKVKFNEADKDLKIDQEQDQDTNSDINTDSNKSDILAGLLDYDSILNFYHSICKSLPKVRELSEARKASMDAAVDVLGGVSFDQLFTKIENSDFLAGRIENRMKNWKCNFDWIMKPENIIKILSGRYDNREPKVTADYSDQSRYDDLKMEVE